MTSLFKNQILKHLSKFTKNLSSDRLNVSAIKGEGELSNLELDEDILTDLLELPTWLKITRASCNRVAIKIQWTKLKSQPICLYLDEVVIEMETCETPRPPGSTTDKSPLSPGGKYGFIEKVMDGIFVHINSVIVKMMSRTFQASLQLSRVKVHSTTPTWLATNDLRTTRIRDASRGEILVFKEIEWQTTRIEAAADESLSKEALTPLRLIANQAKIRIVLKKRLSDCSILSSRVILLLDDLLWVLTLTQLKAAILYSNSLKEVIERSTQQSKRFAAEKLKRQGVGSQSQQQQQQARSQESSNASSAAKHFARFDVVTTSYHLVTSRFDLHLCDDTAATPDAQRHWDVSNGSMQITFYRLSFDFYPFHPADEELIVTRGGERKGWFRYTDNIGTRNPWVQKLFASFREDAVKLRKVCGSPAPSPSASSSKISGGSTAGSNNPSPSHSPSHSATPPSRSPSHHAVPQQQKQKSTRLFESCCVIKVEDLTIYMVSTPNAKRSGHQKFLVSDKKQLHLPSDMSIIHMEYTEYYFPEGIDYPVPHANLYIMVNPVRVTLDFLTMLWSQYFLFMLAQSVELDLGDQRPSEHIDIKLEALMPRIILPGEVKVVGQPERPEAIQMQISKLTASNCRTDGKLTRQDLRKCLDIYYGSHLFHTSEFPNDSLPHRLTPWQLENHASAKDNPYLEKSVKALLECDPNLLQWPNAGITHTLSSDSLKMDAACDVWGLHLEQVWVEFLGVQNFRNRPVPCVEAFPLTMWLGLTHNPSAPSSTEPRLSVQSNATLKSERRGSNSGSPLPCKPEEVLQERRPAHLPLSNRESFDDCHSLQSEEFNLQQPHADNIFFVLSNFGAKMRVQVTHYQYLFLLQLTETFSTFQQELAADLALWGSTLTSITHIPVRIDEAELAIVCPYQMHQRTFSDDFSPSLPNFMEVFGTGSSSTMGQQTMDTTLVPESSFSDPGMAEVTNHVFQTDRGAICDNNNIIPLLNADTPNNASDVGLIQNTNCVSDNINCSHPAAEHFEPTLALEQNVPLPITSDPKTSQMSMSAGTDSGIGLDRISSAKNTKASKGAEVKKAFSSAFLNLTDKIKNTFDDNLSDDLDSMSLKTDTSDDDDFEHLSLDDTDEVPAFVHEGRSDTGSNPDTYSDMDTSSIYADSSTTKGRELVSIILFKLDGLEALLQTCDNGTMLSVILSQLIAHQPGNVGFDDFYGKFSSPKGFLQEETCRETDAPPKFPFRLKYVISTTSPPAADISEPSATAETPASKTSPSAMTVRVEDYSLQFKMSGLACLSEFIEEEKLPEVFPMFITLKNFLLVLNEDRPASNPAMAGALPINCHLDQLHIRRGMDGIYCLSGGFGNSGSREASPCADDTDTMEARGPHTPSSASSLTLLTHTQAENAQLRRQCEELNRANKLYEEQILLLRDKLRVVESECIQQQPATSPSSQRKTRSHSISSVTKNHVSPSPTRNINDMAVGAGLEIENFSLHNRLIQLEDELSNSNKEKESLVSTLHFLQEELLKSERRARSKASTY